MVKTAPSHTPQNSDSITCLVINARVMAIKGGRMLTAPGTAKKLARPLPVDVCTSRKWLPINGTSTSWMTIKSSPWSMVPWPSSTPSTDRRTAPACRPVTVTVKGTPRSTMDGTWMDRLLSWARAGTRNRPRNKKSCPDFMGINLSDSGRECQPPNHHCPAARRCKCPVVIQRKYSYLSHDG